MTPKCAFLVLGPESSGTRLMTRILIAAGCAGDDGHEQRWDAETPTVDKIVWRRSLPHGGQWPKLQTMLSCLYDANYAVQGLIMSRDWYAMSQSQVAAGHARNTDQAIWHSQQAYAKIFEALSAAFVPFEIVNYEALTQRPELTVARLLDRLDLMKLRDVSIQDGNAKYYGDSLRAMAQAADAETLQARIENAYGCAVTVDYAKALITFVEELTH